MSRLFVHPSRSKLRHWLSTPTPSEQMTAHVESCERCASRLVDLADKDLGGFEKATDEAALAQVVKTEWVPPEDLTERVIRGIGERQRNERDLAVVLGLFGVAAETVSLVLPPPPPSPRAPQPPHLGQRSGADQRSIEDTSGENHT